MQRGDRIFDHFLATAHRKLKTQICQVMINKGVEEESKPENSNMLGPVQQRYRRGVET